MVCAVRFDGREDDKVCRDLRRVNLPLAKVEFTSPVRQSVFRLRYTVSIRDSYAQSASLRR